jgi:hypothetical protein
MSAGHDALAGEKASNLIVVTVFAILIEAHAVLAAVKIISVVFV